jgi:phosphopantetheinyl transferase (holo-ACP synthase)
MTSMGNDIVALKAINITRSKQFNFYSKFISIAEENIYNQQLYAEIPFENFVWLLWSIKESVFKYLQRIKPDLVFSPCKICITQLRLPAQNLVMEFEGNEMEGRGFNDEAVYKTEVAFGAYMLYSRSVISNEFIFSAVNHEDDFENTNWGIQAITSSDPEYQSKAVRMLLINRLMILFPGVDLAIGKSPYGYPVLLINGAEETTIPISLTHHNHFVGYSFLLKDKIAD